DPVLGIAWESWMRRICLLISLAAASGLAHADGEHLLFAKRIHTGDAATPAAEAMAWDAKGRVLAIGSRQALSARYQGATRHDAGDATVVPGLVDAHAHLMNLGFALLRAELVDAASKDEVIQRLKAFEATLPEGAWLLGRGWDQNDWTGKQFPTAADLDAAFPDRPVWLERVDGHAGWANRAALRAVERDLSGDWQPDGGRILRDEAGKATGVFIDTAAALVDAVVPPPDSALRAEALERA